uniref:Uncharacterized protein n=1 Tax=viral metagenome TaxID=1070528 RepID=A0A6M3JUV3_9ZZZZ
MILTVFEYAKKFPSKGKMLSPKTIIRRCVNDLLPSDHHAQQLPSKSDEKGQWIIEIPDEILEIKVTKTSPVKPNIKTINRRYFNFK